MPRIMLWTLKNIYDSFWKTIIQACILLLLLFFFSVSSAALLLFGFLDFFCVLFICVCVRLCCDCFFFHSFSYASSCFVFKKCSLFSFFLLYFLLCFVLYFFLSKTRNRFLQRGPCAGVQRFAQEVHATNARFRSDETHSWYWFILFLTFIFWFYFIFFWKLKLYFMRLSLMIRSFNVLLLMRFLPSCHVSTDSFHFLLLFISLFFSNLWIRYHPSGLE